MQISDLFSITVFLAVLLVCIPFLGMFLAQLYLGRPTFLYPFLGWLERFTYKILAINPSEEMNARRYIGSLLWFSFWGLVLLFCIQIFQTRLPLNPQQMPDVPWLLALNTAVSFVTNTNWQAYVGETTMSHGTQMWGLTVQNFLSAASGNAVLMAFIRGFVRKSSSGIGNFWADIVRSVIYLLLPLSFLLSLILVSQGVVQTLSPYVSVETLEGEIQLIPVGPVASQVAIKEVGSNGGGFFNANSSHPFENPSHLSNFLQTLMIILIPAASVYAFSILIHSKKRGWWILAAMALFWLTSLTLSIYSESIKNPILEAFPVLEGKETRFAGIDTLLWMNSTTGTSNGSVNAMHSSLSPLAGGVALLNMMLEEVVFGGIGIGLCNMLIFILLTVFLSGLMVGRTPEYLGKKVEKQEMPWVVVVILVPSILILLGSSITCLFDKPMNDLSSSGPHRLTTLLYAFTSTAMNNGSAFANINANTDFYNASFAVVMLLGRLSGLIPCLVLAGHFAAKKMTPPSPGTLVTDTFLFALMLFFVIIITCALTFFPALSLGPIMEHMLMLRGQSFPYVPPG